jgi:hypothetical protein
MDPLMTVYDLVSFGGPKPSDLQAQLAALCPIGAVNSVTCSNAQLKFNEALSTARQRLLFVGLAIGGYFLYRKRQAAQKAATK